MNANLKKSLEAVVVAMVEQDTTTASAEFREYVRLKSQSILLGEKSEKDEKDEDCEVDKDEKDEDDKDEDKTSDDKGESKDKDDKK